MSDSTASLDVVIDPSGAQSGAAAVKRSLNDIKTTSQQLMSDMTKSFQSLKNLLASIISGYALKRLADSFIDAARSAEDYRTSIRAVSASIKEADETFDRIRHWAAVNPIDTDEAVGAFVRLRTAAVENSEGALSVIADLSTTMQRDMRDVADALVTTRTESLRNLGVILDRTGKQATIQFGEVRKTVEKDIDSVRAGVLEVLEESIGGAMRKAANTYSGILATMSGMWTTFQQDVMGTGSAGPFDKLKTSLAEVRNEWEKFTSSRDYKIMVSDIQNALVAGIKAASDGAKLLGDALSLARNHADELKAVAAALVTYKITLGVTELISSLRTALTLAQTLAATSLATPVGLAAGAIGAIAGVAVYSKSKKDMKELQEQTEKTEDAIAALNAELQNAPRERIQASLSAITNEISATEEKIVSLKSSLESLQSEFQNEPRMLDKRAIGQQINAVADEIEAAQKTLAVQQKSRDYVQDMLTSVPKTAVPAAAQNSAAPAATSSKGKSAAELMVEKIRDEMKYLGKDGNDFLTVLDKWQSKLKPLSEDWKAITDLKFDILGDNAKEAAEDAELALKRIQKQKDEAKELAEVYDRANREWLSSLGWEKEQGFMSSEQYFAQLKNMADELGLATKNAFNFTDYEKSLYSALQSAGVEGFTKDIEALNEQYSSGKIKTDAYTASVEALVEKWGSFPLVVNSASESTKKAAEQMKTGIKDLNELTTQWIKDLQDGIAGAIAEGNDFGDTLTSIGEEIEKLALKSVLFGQNGTSGMFGGIFGGLLSWLGGNAKGNAYTSSGRLLGYAKGGVPTLHDYVNTVHNTPKLFGFSQGMGVFGEAGSEGILPLARNSRGELGVKAVGSGASGSYSSVFNITVQNNGSGEMTDEQAQGLGDKINAAVERKVAEELYKYQRTGVFRNAYAR